VILVFLSSFFCARAALAENTRNLADKVDFNREIRPILSENCYKCHGPDDEARKAKLRFDVRTEALKPAKSGNTAIVAGAPEKSELIARITAQDEDERMPPLKTGKKLSPAQIECLRRWIAQGAAYATHWAYVKPVRPALPPVKGTRWLRNSIDRFILARLEKEGLKPSAEANRYTLARRVALDLTGLPPSVKELDKFINDRNPMAYERFVDDLLSKPSFGEHWARMWLDLARYADSAGYADDPPRTIWAYRDYVIKSFNSNKPFDHFTIEQIAGDLLDDADEEDLIGTAFHRNTMTNNEGGTSDEEFRNAAVVDRVNTTMAAWMATSMGCAQCHTHKYDPITQQDYFRLFAIFNNTADADLKDESPLLELYSPKQKSERSRLQNEIVTVQKPLMTATPESSRAQSEWERNFRQEVKWLVLDPISMKARDGGSIVRAQNSRLEISAQQKIEQYTAEFALSSEFVSGLRIEVSSPSSKKTPEGNAGFTLTHVSATIASPGVIQPAGRYVRIQIPGKSRILSLAEVQVFAGKTNVALRGEASQSSTAYEGEALLAIDDNPDGDFETAKSTTHTEESENPWWEVDLKRVESLDRIVIWNRTDHELQGRLEDFRVALFDENRKKVWERTVSKKAPSPSATFALDGSLVLNFVTATTDVTQPTSDIRSVIEDSTAPKRTGWTVDPDDSLPHYLTLLPAEPVLVTPGSKLRVTIDQVTKREHAPAAWLRLSASIDDRVSEYATLPDPMMRILTMSSSERSEKEQESLSKYYVANVMPALQPQREELKKLKKQLADIMPETVPIIRELAAEKRRSTRIQIRGNYLAMGDEVSAAVPAAFHPLAQGAVPNRLSLARWLVDEDNPLTARVVANRFWEQIFGIGLVRTSDDFGTQGDRPSHPELLDWLATELETNKWNVKGFLKLLVTSSAYRQSSKVTRQLLERDPENILLARGPRFRMPAEVIRDQALFVSGLLSARMYGAPVRPPRPSLGLSAAFGGSLDWKTSEGEDRYRRALYIEWRRTSPYPSMATFDAPNREVCALRRPRSNTPLQALVTLNDPVYIEAAQALGRRMSQSTGSIDEKICYGFRLCLARPPHDSELQRLNDFFRRAAATFSKDAGKAEQMATEPLGALPPGADKASLAAWTAVGNVLLNLDETLMRP
jgi:hypothetical protein